MEGGNSCGNNFHHGKIITKELEDVVVGIEGALAGDAAPSEETIAELQLQTARKLRQLLPTCRDSLHLIQERNWIPLLLGWLNLHDRPAVQIEALWALTNIAGLSSPSWTASPPTTYFPQASSTKPQSNGSYASFLSESLPSVPSSQPSDRKMNPLPSLNSGAFPQAPQMTQAMKNSVGSFTKISSGFTSGFSSNKCFSSTNSATVLSPTMTLAAPAPLISPNSSHPCNTQSNSVPSLNLSNSLPPTSPSSHLLLRHPDAIPTLVSLLSSSNHEVHEQALWILGCVAAGDGGGVSNYSGSSNGSSNATNPASASSSVAAARETMLAAGVIPSLVHCVESNLHNLSLQRIGSWALSNLVDGQFQQNNNTKNGNSNHSGSNNYHSEIDAKLIMPTLRRLLYMADAEVLSHTCWTLSHLCDGLSSHIAAIVSPAGGLVPRLVDLLLHPSWRVTKPALRTIGNIVCAECVDDSTSGSHTASFTFGENASSTPHIADFTEIILEYGAVPRLKELITHGNREIQKEACWTLSNIAAGTVDQIQAVIDCGAIAPLVKLASDPSTDQEVRSEACWVVLNATSCGSDAQIEILVSEGCVSVLGVLLGEASMVMMALEGLERVLQVEETKELARRTSSEETKEKNQKCVEIDTEYRRGSVVSASLIEALEQHKNTAVSKRAGKIWKQHFVNCALCRQSYSRHRSSEVSFCKECKCHVCFNCDCEIYHLRYQEELWAVSEKKTQTNAKVKKSKKQKKNKKNRNKKNNSDQDNDAKKSTSNHQASSNKIKSISLLTAEELLESSSASTGSLSASESRRPPLNEFALVSSETSPPRESKKNILNSAFPSNGNKESKNKPKNTPSPSIDIEHGASNQKTKDYNDIDLVLYLQQTGSIIALAKLMDALDYGELDGCDTFSPDEIVGDGSHMNHLCYSQHAKT